jgi:hypothetical protein
MSETSTTNEACYATWAPEDMPWSPWVRPVPFTQLEGLALTREIPDLTGFEGLRLPDAKGCALIVDLPGSESVLGGLAIAERGWRPVPLFNSTTGPAPLVDVRPIAQQLYSGSWILREIRIPPEAPPAFLIDADRMKGTPVPGRYDNRAIVLPQDFPSGTLLRSKRIDEALLIRRGGTSFGEDLSHVLVRWQEAGIRLSVLDLQAGGDPEQLRVGPPRLFRRAWYGVVALFGLRRNNVGGFGGLIPEVTSGGRVG